MISNGKGRSLESVTVQRAHAACHTLMQLSPLQPFPAEPLTEADLRRCSPSQLQPFPAAALPSPLQPFLHRCFLVGKGSLCFCEGGNLSKIYSFASLLRTHVCSLASCFFSDYVEAKEYQKRIPQRNVIITLWKKLLVWIQVDPDALPMSFGVHP